MRLIKLILILLISNLTFGQNKYVGIYNNQFLESIELKSDSSFTHKWRFDLVSSWTNGKWKIINDTIYFKTELVMDTIQIRNSENKVVRDSLVLSIDQKPNRIELDEFQISLISSGSQNHYKPPQKLYWKKNRLYRIKLNGTLDLRRIKGFWTNKKYKTYYRKETE